MFKQSLKIGALLLTFFAQSALADFITCGKSGDELNQFRAGKSLQQLAAAYVDDCAVHSQLLSEVQVFLARIRVADDTTRAGAVRQSLLLLNSQFAQQFLSPDTGNMTAISTMRTELNCERLALTSQSELSDDDKNAWDSCENNLASADGTVSLQKWWPKPTGPVFNDGFLTPFAGLGENCLSKQFGVNQECDRAFIKDFLPVLEYQSVMHSQVRPAANQEQADQIAAYYSSSHEKWKSYLSDTGFQYPWELTFNRWKRGGFEEIAQREAAPTSRFIVVHPTVAIAYSEESPDGDQMRLMGVLKVFGYKWWRFKNNRADQVWGISATINMADAPGVDDGGYGLMLEYDQFALGWSNHGSDDVVSVSIDLGSLLSDRPDTLQEWFEKLD